MISPATKHTGVTLKLRIKRCGRCCHVRVSSRSWRLAWPRGFRGRLGIIISAEVTGDEAAEPVADTVAINWGAWVDMNDLVSGKASLPSLPSGFALPDSETAAYMRQQLCLKCAAALLPVAEYEQEAARQTLALLLLAGEQIIQDGRRIPFAFSASTMAMEVQRYDCLGPARLGFYYENKLKRDCHFLVPRRITENDLLSFRQVLATWEQNRRLFHSPVIGAVLMLKYFHFQKRRGCDEF